MKQPNIILILTDHFRPDAVGGSTPNLRKLAGRGVQFTNSYAASPLCQPSRASIVTGLYPSQHGICGNMAEPLGEDMRRNTFMQHLQAAGYFTALVGRHHYTDHFGIVKDVLEEDGLIASYGFDHVWQVLNPCEHEYNDDRLTHLMRERGILDDYRKALKKTGGGFPFPEEYYDDCYIGRTARDFIRDYAEDKPFYLNIGFSGPHPPLWHPGKRRHDPAKMAPPRCGPPGKRVRRRRADYMDKCQLIDQYIGELLDALKERGMLDDTVIIFSSDHGDMLGDFGIWDKRYFYEQSVGVPLVMAGPRVPRGERDLVGKVSKALVSGIDLYPTILTLAGADEAPLAKRPGRDLLTILREERGAARREVVAELATAVMIRTANWKLVFDAEQDGVQWLFNLAVDPGEEHNLAGVAGYEAVTGDLCQRLLAHRIRLTQYTHHKEEARLQRVRITE